MHQASAHLRALTFKANSVCRILLICSCFIALNSLLWTLLAGLIRRGRLPIKSGTPMGKLIIHNLSPLFSVNIENNVPTFYACILLLIAATCLFLASEAAAFRKKGESKRRAHGWQYLSALFILAAFDEFASLHERLHDLPNLLSAAPILSNFQRLPWYIPALAIALAALLPTIPFIKSLPTKTIRLFLIAGATYLAGAIGFEAIGLSIIGAQPNYSDTVIYALASTMEEFLEMSGIIIFIYSVLTFLASNGQEPCMICIEKSQDIGSRLSPPMNSLARIKRRFTP